MSKIYDALVRAELDRASAAQANRGDSDSPEALLTRDILASLSQDRWSQPAAPVPPAAPHAQATVVEEVEEWHSTADPEGTFPEPIAVWNPSQNPQAEPMESMVPLKTCPNCSLPYGARTERKGFFQKRIASFFGYFPWTCKACRTNFYSKDRGASPPEVAGAASH